MKSYTAIWFQRRDVAKKPLASRLTFLIHSLLLKHGENSTYHKRLNTKVIFLSKVPATWLSCCRNSVNSGYYSYIKQ